MVDAPLRVTNLNSSRHCITFVTTEKKNNCCVFFIVCKITELRDRMDKGQFVWLIYSIIS